MLHTLRGQHSSSALQFFYYFWSRARPGNGTSPAFFVLSGPRGWLLRGAEPRSRGMIPLDVGTDVGGDGGQDA